MRDGSNAVKKYIFKRNLVKVKDGQDHVFSTESILKTVHKHALKVGAPRPKPFAPPESDR
eukprot:SAG31_NODE_30199_length_384_cov_0.905263_1_plen_59_part_01